MRRWLATLATVALVSPLLHADVTLTSTMTIEGGAAALMGGGMSPRLVMRLKGSKMRTDIDLPGQSIVTIVDLTSKQAFLLHPDQKSAQMFDGTPSGGSPGTPAFTMPKIGLTFTPTGHSRAIDGAPCDEYVVTMAVSVSEMTAGAQTTPDAAGMFKDLRIAVAGTSWVARSGPGVAEYIAFQKVAADANMAAILSAAVPAMGSAGLGWIMSAQAAAPGLPYLTEMNMSLEGSGQLVEMMKQLGTMTITTKVTAVATDPISDDMFKVPDGYTITK